MADGQLLDGNAVFANTVEVRRADKAVALVIEVCPRDMQHVSLDEPLTVLAGFEEPERAAKLATSFFEAIGDAREA